MFESEDFDQLLSQLDWPATAIPDINESNKSEQENQNKISSFNSSPVTSNNLISTITQNECNLKTTELVSPKHSKRKMINTLFDTNSKRKFPGPAGLLTGSLDENEDDNICHMELLSQDVDFTQNNSGTNIFDSPLWNRLLDDVQHWNLGNINSIKIIKQQALDGNLQKRKAQTVTAFVEAVDRSATDPLVILRDRSGSIKCTLHRDAWLAFSLYIASEHCAIILRKPTVLTTGGAFKKHYLNITLSNIYAIYSSAVLKDDADAKPLIDGYIKIYEEDFTIIKTKVNETDLGLTSEQNGSIYESDHLLGDLDSSIFLEDIF